MKNYTLLLLSIFFYQFSFAQNDWSVFKIHPDLKANANAVIRLDETEFTIESIGKANIKKHWVVSIFNEEGENDFARFESYYDKFSKIKKIEGSIYDQTGKLLKKLKSSEIKDLGLDAYSDGVGDSRIKIAEFDKKYYPYPYTVEFSFEKEETNMLFYESWLPVCCNNTALEKSTFIIKTSAGINYSKKEFNLKIKSTKSTDSKYNTEKWELENYRGFEQEEYSRYETLPRVIFAPTDFIVDGNVGNMNSWENLSTFLYNLNKNRDELPQATIDKLKMAVGGEKDPYKKIKLVYEFMQSHTRYVSIQLGIGGWQTITAKEVADKGYGDCKALTNYTLALLKQVGITGYNAVIRAGEDEVFENEEFVSSRFNHVLACIPMVKDTVWLECTSQTNPFGYQGDFTGNRKALLLKEKGGKLVNTYKYKPEDNLQKRNLLVTIEENGNAKILVKSTYTGIQQDTKAYIYQSKNLTDQKEWLMKHINLPAFELVNIKPNIIKNKLPEVTEELDINVVKLASTSGPRMFIKLNVFTSFLQAPIVKENRQTNLFLNPNYHNFVDSDSTVFNIPAGFKVEFIPKDIIESNEFGKFTTKTYADNNKIVFLRKVEINAKVFPKEYFEKWANFVKLVNKTDAQKMVLVKKTS